MSGMSINSIINISLITIYMKASLRRINQLYYILAMKRFQKLGLKLAKQSVFWNVRTPWWMVLFFL